MTATIIGGVIGQWPLGLWSDRVDRRWVLALICMLGIVVSLLTWWLTPQLSIEAIMALGFAWGALAFPTYSISVAHANDWADPGTFVEVSAGLLLLYGVGAIIGPLLAPIFMALLGASGMFAFNAIIFAGLLAYTLVRIRRRPAADEAHHRDFNEAITAARTMSVVYEAQLDAEEEGRG